MLEKKDKIINSKEEKLICRSAWRNKRNIY